MTTAPKITAPTAEERVYAMAARYGDEEGTLGDSAVRALHTLQARAGKACGRCSARRPLSAFSRDASQASGLRRTCRACDADRYRRRVNG